MDQPSQPGFGPPMKLDSAPSLSAILDQYKMHSESFQKEMESFTMLPSPDGKDGNWQNNAIKFLNSPVSSPKARLGNPNASEGFPAMPMPSSSQPLYSHQPPRPQLHHHQAPNHQQPNQNSAYGELLPTTSSGPPPPAVAPRPSTLGIAPFHTVASWGTPENVLQRELMQKHTSQSSGDGSGSAAELWQSQLSESSAMPSDGPPRSLTEGIRALTSQLSISTIQENLRQQQQMPPPPPMPQLAVQVPEQHSGPRQSHYVTTGMLTSAWAEATGRTASAAMPMPTLAVPPSTYGPASAPVAPPPAQLAMFSKRQRSVRSQLTFEAYENQYGPSAKCDSGPCADHCITPCKQHTCKCCKKHRRLETAGAARTKGYCGKCSRREKVDGLEFVKCGHVQMVDGALTQCGVEMLRDVFDNHWKQHKNDAAPMSLDVDTDEGRKCGACTNMRPVTFYPNQDTNCSCNHCQIVKSKATKSGAPSDAARRVSTPTGNLGSQSNVFASTGSEARRHSYTGPGTPSHTQLTTGTEFNNTDQSPPSSVHNLQQWSNAGQSADSLGGGMHHLMLGMSTSTMRGLSGTTMSQSQAPSMVLSHGLSSMSQSQLMSHQLSSMSAQQMEQEQALMSGLLQETTSGLMSSMLQESPSALLSGLLAEVPSGMVVMMEDGSRRMSSGVAMQGPGVQGSMSGSVSGLSGQLSEDPVVQQAHGIFTNALSSVLAARPTLEVLLARCQELRYQPAGPAQAATHAALARVVKASEEVQRDVQRLMAEANSLLAGTQ